MPSGNPSGSLAGRVVVVTGGTSGIGRQVVEGLAALGADTLLVGRGVERVQRAAEEVRTSTGNPAVEGVPVNDLALASEWHRLSDELLRRRSAIHVIVHNAGAYYARREVTAEGRERTFALNVLAPLAITTRLSDRLRASAPARVIHVASAAHHGRTVPLDDLEARREYSGFEQYGRSKLELILLTRELARRFAGSEVTVNSLHPGFVRSGFGSNNRGATSFLLRVAAAVAGRSVRYGASEPVRLASDPTLAHVSGEYFSGGRIALGSAASRDASLAERLYRRCVASAELHELALPAGLSPSRPGAGGSVSVPSN